MNKDTNLSYSERMNLQISDNQLHSEILERCQVYFEPDHSSKLNLEDLKEFVTCAKCKKIPLDLQQCEGCSSIVCEPCQREIMKKSQENSFVKKFCPSCKVPNQFKFTKVKQNNFQKLIRQMTEMHSCCV